MKSILKIRNNPSFVSSFSIFFFIVSLLAVSLLVGRVLLSENPFNRFLVTIFYFTTQSNFLIFFVILFYLLKKDKGNLFKVFAFIALIDITMTGFFFHILLASYMENVGFMQQVLHTVVPIFYIAFYFIILKDTIKINKFWISLIHPVIYVVLVYLLIHPFFGDILIEVMTDLPGASYVYPFLDPSRYSMGVPGLLIFICCILTPVILLTSLLMIYTKSKLELAIIKQSNL